MIKIIYIGKKHSGTTLEAFKSYYLERHAPLFMKNAPQVQKYTINFPNSPLGNDTSSPDYDFITEIWWEDTESVHAFYGSEVYKNVIRPDEQKLFAAGSAVHFDEFVQKS